MAHVVTDGRNPQFKAAFDDAGGLRTVNWYAILDTSPEPTFDRLAKLAVTICGAPAAAISFLDGSRHRFKTRVGIGEDDLAACQGCSEEALLQPTLLVRPDVTLDERFKRKTRVTDGPVFDVMRARRRSRLTDIDSAHCPFSMRSHVNRAPSSRMHGWS